MTGNEIVEPNHRLRTPSNSTASEEETPVNGVNTTGDIVRLSSTVRRSYAISELNNEDQAPGFDVSPRVSEKRFTTEYTTDTDSVHSARLEPSFEDSEPSTRISVAMSDGEVGIGLSLLQDFMGGGDDDAASTFSRRSRAQTPEAATTSDAAMSRNTPDSTVEGRIARSVRSARSESQYSSSSRGTDVTPSHTHTAPLNYREKERSSPTSVHPSVDSSDFGGDEWEGASDIYDNYRYSRFSMASKISRFSKGSMHTLASGFGVPPVPAEYQSSSSEPRSVEVNTDRATPSDSHRRPSVESRHSSDRVGDDTGTTDERGKRVPPPLNLSSGTSGQDVTHSRHDSLGPEGEQSPSPLLHTTFSSPPPSATPHSTKSFLSAPLTSPMFPSAGVASALRQRLELDRPLQPSSDLIPTMESNDTMQRDSGFDIVVDDDQHIPPIAGPSDTSMTSSMSMDTSFTESNESSSTIVPPVGSTSEKSLLMMTAASAEPAPPPYTQMATGAEISPSVDPGPGPSAQPRSPPMNATRRPANAGGPPPNPNARTSLFMPHPHAPKPTNSPAGPMYGRQLVAPAHLMPRAEGPPPGTIFHSLNMVLVARHEGRPGRGTIYGRFERDLASSIGPVPVSFSLDPPQPPVIAGMNGMKRVAVGANVVRTGSPLNRQPSPLAGGESSTAQFDPNLKQGPESPLSPRANFFPKSPNPRPRSRSFSGFDKPIAEMFLPQSKRFVFIFHTFTLLIQNY